MRSPNSARSVGFFNSLLDGKDPMMFKVRSRSAITRYRIRKALFKPGGGVVIIGDDAFVRVTTEALELLKNKITCVER